MTAGQPSATAENGSPAQTPAVHLPRGRLLIVGTGAFGVTMLPSWIVLLRHLYRWQIRACITHAASDLVAPGALAAATQAPVAGPHWDTRSGTTQHQELAQWADLVLVAPATTNFLAKCAHGMPDSLALSTVMSATVPVVLALSIPAGARARPSVQRNFALVEEDGYRVVHPKRGLSVHSGEQGEGSMADIITILRFLAGVMPPEGGGSVDGAPDGRAGDTAAPPVQEQRLA